MSEPDLEELERLLSLAAFREDLLAALARIAVALERQVELDRIPTSQVATFSAPESE